MIEKPLYSLNPEPAVFNLREKEREPAIGNARDPKG
jgi:hypothetical protein